MPRLPYEAGGHGVGADIRLNARRAVALMDRFPVSDDVTYTVGDEEALEDWDPAELAAARGDKVQQVLGARRRAGLDGGGGGGAAGEEEDEALSNESPFFDGAAAGAAAAAAAAEEEWAGSWGMKASDVLGAAWEGEDAAVEEEGEEEDEEEEEDGEEEEGYEDEDDEGLGEEEGGYEGDEGDEGDAEAAILRQAGAALERLEADAARESARAASPAPAPAGGKEGRRRRRRGGDGGAGGGGGGGGDESDEAWLRSLGLGRGLDSLPGDFSL